MRYQQVGASPYFKKLKHSKFTTTKVLDTTWVSSCLIAEIIETNTIHTISEHIVDDILILFDLDNTLIEAPQMLGSDQWFYYQKKYYMKNEALSEEVALSKALDQWTAIQYVSSQKIVEEGADLFIRHLQSNNIVCLGFTTCSISVAARTIKLLDDLNIDFTKTSPFNEEHYI